VRGCVGAAIKNCRGALKQLSASCAAGVGCEGQHQRSRQERQGRSDRSCVLRAPQESALKGGVGAALKNSSEAPSRSSGRGADPSAVADALWMLLLNYLDAALPGRAYNPPPPGPMLLYHRSTAYWVLLESGKSNRRRLCGSPWAAKCLCRTHIVCVTAIVVCLSCKSTSMTD
jgi:hypothetical protein